MCTIYDEFEEAFTDLLVQAEELEWDFEYTQTQVRLALTCAWNKENLLELHDSALALAGAAAIVYQAQGTISCPCCDREIRVSRTISDRQPGGHRPEDAWASRAKPDSDGTG